MAGKSALRVGVAAMTVLLFASCARAVDEVVGPRPVTVQEDRPTTRAPAATPGYVPGELIVKLTPEAGQVLDQALKVGRPPTATGLVWLDVLGQRYGVTTIVPLIRHHTDPEAIKAKFPGRAKRAPPGAQPQGLRHIYTFQLRSDVNLLQAVTDFGSHPDIEYAQPNYRVTIQGDE